jgi:hypothetical protein
LQHHGQQVTDELNYIMESRPEKGLYLFIHDAKLPRQHDDSEVPRGYDDIQRKKDLENDHELGVTRCIINRDAPAEVPVVSHSAWDWRWAVAAARSRTEAIRTTAHEQVARATRFVGDGDGDGLAESVLDTLQPLSSQECVCKTRVRPSSKAKRGVRVQLLWLTLATGHGLVTPSRLSTRTGPPNSFGIS